MDILNISQPTGFWATIITAFENGVGSYLLAIVLITLILKIVMSPFDLFNRKISKNQTQMQAKLKPQLDEIQKKYANDRNLLNQKTQEIYKKSGMNMGGSCLFMLIFMILNMTIFISLFGSLNGFADYKINQQYLSMKNSYANSLNLIDNYYTINQTDCEDMLENYENIKFIKENNKFKAKDNNENIIFETDYVDKFSTDEEIKDLINKYISKDEENTVVFIGDVNLNTNLKINTAAQNLAYNQVVNIYEGIKEENSFLWIKSIWIADSPFKSSVFSFEEYKNEIGANNVSAQEEDIYNSFMLQLKQQEGKVNGYFILAILSVGVSFLSMWLTQYTTKKKKQKNGLLNQDPVVKTNSAMFIIMPLITGIFAIFYNSVFAIYLLISQAVSACLAPLNNFIIKKIEIAQQKKKASKEKVVDYKR